MSKSWKRSRRDDIIAAWPIEKQLEALVDAMKVPPDRTKINELLNAIAAIQSKYPKP